MKINSLNKFLIILLSIFISLSHITAQDKDKKEISIVSISNKEILVNISTKGAEVQNIIAQPSGKEYLWQGDPAYWGGRSPILFPFVGRLWGNGYNYEGKRYQMPGHGFAQNCVFKLISQKESEVWFKITDSPKTMEMYPFQFELMVGYILDGKRLKVVWNVANKSSRTMPFQIGAHPGFLFPDFDESSKCKGYLSFETIEDNLTFMVKEKNYFLSPNPIKHTLVLDKDRLLPITQELFKDDALIFENYQIRKVTILNKNKKPYLAMEFDIPVLGLWSLPHKNAPYICIESWWGIEGKMDFNEEFTKRDWTLNIVPNENFVTSYSIHILE